MLMLVPAQAQNAQTQIPPPARTMIVLDASGSMWGRLDNRPKLDIARSALRQVVGTLPPESEVGLMVYGHRQRGECGDIQTIVAPAPRSGSAIIQAADRLQFLGKTPLTEAVRRAARELRHSEGRTTVVLITDGIETCAADPCALGRELKRTGVGFTAHVVGFGLTREEGRQVACLAEATGGRYLDARNEPELREALNRTIGQASTPAPSAPAPTPAVTLPRATVATDARPTIGAAFAVRWTGPNAPGDYIDIAPAGATEIGNEPSYAYVDAGSPVSLRAPGQTGAYQLRYIWRGPDRRHVLATAPITVGDSPYALIAPASVSAGAAISVSWKGPGQSGDYIDIAPATQREAGGEINYMPIDQDNPLSLRAPAEPGRYLLRYVLEAPGARHVLVSVPLLVTPASASIAAPETALTGSSVSVHWRGPGGDSDYIDVVKAGHTTPDGEITYATIGHSSDGETVTLTLPTQAGTYALRYILQGPDSRRVLATQAITVSAANASLSTPASVRRGAEIVVTWTGPNGSRDFIDIAPAGRAEADGELGYFYTHSATDRRGSLTAPDRPGTYEVRYILQGAESALVLARRTIRVE